MLKKYKNKIKLLTMMLIIFASFGQVKAAEFLPINCPQVYQPVCGKVTTSCFSGTCPTIEKTYSNSCVLNQDSQATFAYNGVCQPAHTCLLNSPPPEFCQTGEKVIVTERDNYGCAVHYGCTAVADLWETSLLQINKALGNNGSYIIKTKLGITGLRANTIIPWKTYVYDSHNKLVDTCIVEEQTKKDTTNHTVEYLDTSCIVDYFNNHEVNEKFKFLVVIDPENKIKEINENNNKKSKFVNINNMVTEPELNIRNNSLSDKLINERNQHISALNFDLTAENSNLIIEDLIFDYEGSANIRMISKAYLSILRTTTGDDWREERYDLSLRDGRAYLNNANFPLGKNEMIQIMLVLEMTNSSDLFSRNSGLDIGFDLVKINVNSNSADFNGRIRGARHLVNEISNNELPTVKQVNINKTYKNNDGDYENILLHRFKIDTRSDITLEEIRYDLTPVNVSFNSPRLIIHNIKTGEKNIIRNFNKQNQNELYRWKMNHFLDDEQDYYFDLVASVDMNFNHDSGYIKVNIDNSNHGLEFSNPYASGENLLNNEMNSLVKFSNINSNSGEITTNIDMINLLLKLGLSPEQVSDILGVDVQIIKLINLLSKINVSENQIKLLLSILTEEQIELIINALDR